MENNLPFSKIYSPLNIENIQMINKLAYHVTDINNLNSILSNGLEPKIGERSGELNCDGKPLEIVKRVYMFPDKDSLENALYNWLGEAFEEIEGIELVILKIDITGLDLESDVEYELASREVILAERIVEIYNESWNVLK